MTTARNVSIILSSLFFLTLLYGCNSGGGSATLNNNTPPRTQVVKPSNLCIFYGQPDMVNQSQTTNEAIDAFSHCSVLVLGDGLQEPSHRANNATKTIVNELTKRGILVFGYLDAGVSTQNLDSATAQTSVVHWKALNVSGIFLDDFGFDFGVTRQRQNIFIDLVHNNDLIAFINAFNPSDVFETVEGAQPHIQEGDFYLAENWLYADDTFTDLSIWQTKANALFQYVDQHKVKIAATATRTSLQSGIYDYQTAAWSYAYWGSVLQEASLFQWTDEDFGATNSTLIEYPTPSENINNAYFAGPIECQQQNNNVTCERRIEPTGGSIKITKNDMEQVSVSVYR